MNPKTCQQLKMLAGLSFGLLLWLGLANAASAGVQWLTVTDSNNQSGADIETENLNIEDGGHNSGWRFDYAAPVLSAGGPSGELGADTTSATLSVTTTEAATCKYGTTANTAYADLTSSLVSSDNLTHAVSVTVAAGQSYTYYVRCADVAEGNQNSDDYEISFSVASAPPARNSGGGTSGGMSGAGLVNAAVKAALQVIATARSLLPAVPVSSAGGSALGANAPILGGLAGDLISKLVPSTKSLVPVELAVTKTAPLALRGEWDLIDQQRLNELVLAPLPKELRTLAAKFPSLEKTLAETGVAKITDLSKLQNAKLILPALGDFARANPGDLAQALPREVVFSQGLDGAVDFNNTLTVNEFGQPEQQIATIVGQPLNLSIKPDGAVRAVTGYLLFKSRSAPVATKPKLPLTALLASPLFLGRPVKSSLALDDHGASPIDHELVLQEFAYTDADHDGLWTATISALAAAGEYEVMTALDYVDPNRGRRIVRLTTVVDPEGYIYTAAGGGEQTRVLNAVVTLERQTAAGEWALWPARDYQQLNPQTTDLSGTYSFLVPPGDYRLQVVAEKYQTYLGPPFRVELGRGVHQNIELKRKGWLASWFGN